MEHQTFEDSTFDLVISLDVMEHVFDWAAAFRDVGRTLKPGGAHVFTTPMYAGLRRSEVRARKLGDKVEHLVPEPEYHGNPIDPGGSLVTVHWGADIGDLIFRASGLTTTVYRLFDPSRGIQAEFIEVFVSSKPYSYNS